MDKSSTLLHVPEELFMELTLAHPNMAALIGSCNYYYYIDGYVPVKTFIYKGEKIGIATRSSMDVYFPNRKSIPIETMQEYGRLVYINEGMLRSTPELIEVNLFQSTPMVVEEHTTDAVFIDAVKNNDIGHMIKYADSLGFDSYRIIQSATALVGKRKHFHINRYKAGDMDDFASLVAKEIIYRAKYEQIVKSNSR